MVYAYEMASRAVLWTFSTSSTSTIRSKPQATRRRPVCDGGPRWPDPPRIASDRRTRRWQSPEAFRFIAVNKKFVYKRLDKYEKLLVLDRAKGTVLAT